MRVVTDTSVLVSAMLWPGPPHEILVAAERGEITLYTSAILIEELEGVLWRPKFTARLDVRRTTVEELVGSYVKLAHVVQPDPISPVIIEDPEDDAVLACALTANAHAVISGDQHLRSLKRYQSIPIVSPRAFLEHMARG
jgi:putative PIN family toxin of toxin-antitoxin system